MPQLLQPVSLTPVKMEELTAALQGLYSKLNGVFRPHSFSQFVGQHPQFAAGAEEAFGAVL
jgi:hypothetical protein